MKRNQGLSGKSGGMTVKIWGARGSLPAPMTPVALEKKMLDCFQLFLEGPHKDRTDLHKFFADQPQHVLGGYGGNTLCVEVKRDDHRLIIDGGSGIRQLGYELMAGPCGRGEGEAHILFTHFHWDHLIGLPFFVPLFIPGNTIHVYAVQPELEEAFRILFKKPYFPVPLDKLGAKIVYHYLTPRTPISVQGFEIVPYQLDHPDACWGFRISRGGKVFSHCVDTECTRFNPEQLGEDLPLYQDVDLMLFDAQYTLMETIEKVDWGHASASLGLDIAMREGIKQVVFMHHDPASSEEKVAAGEAQARRYYTAQLKAAQKAKHDIFEVDWVFAHEGMEIEI